MGRMVHFAEHVARLALVMTFVVAAGCADDAAPLSDSQRSLVELARTNGAASLEASRTADGGMLVGGTLDGQQFALVVPEHWNHRSLLFAHGYSLPGSPLAVADNPVVTDPAAGMFGLAYSQGYAVGHSAYAKAGMGVQSAVTSTMRLKTLVEHLGSEQVYVAGASMGGNIVMALIEQHPGAFKGAIAACGVTDGWTAEIGALMDIRAVYNYFTEGTEYALPGERSIAASALAVEPPALLGWAGTPFRLLQMKRVADPILTLFKAAREQPGGEADLLIKKIASLTAFQPEVASFIAPLLTVSLGMDDLNATFGGLIYDNSAKEYRSPLLSDAENAELNKQIERVRAEPAAVAYADRWHRTTGRFETPLIAIHNQVDSLVPYAQLEGLIARAGDAQNQANLVSFTVPSTLVPVPGSDLQGLSHCGFSPEQIGQAWNALVQWTQQGARPQFVPVASE